MAAGDIETYFEDGQWKNKSSGLLRLATSHATKEEACLVARELARYRGVEHIVRNEDDTIEERHSYRSEP